MWLWIFYLFVRCTMVAFVHGLVEKGGLHAILYIWPYRRGYRLCVECRHHWSYHGGQFSFSVRFSLGVVLDFDGCNCPFRCFYRDRRDTMDDFGSACPCLKSRKLSRSFSGRSSFFYCNHENYVFENAAPRWHLLAHDFWH